MNGLSGLIVPHSVINQTGKDSWFDKSWEIGIMNINTLRLLIRSFKGIVKALEDWLGELISKKSKNKNFTD
jgi:hypothetical protein